MNWQQVGENIKRHRNSRQKKQLCFAREIGKTRQMLSRYENGRSVIPLKTLEVIAQKLGVPLFLLLNIEETT